MTESKAYICSDDGMGDNHVSLWLWRERETSMAECQAKQLSGQVSEAVCQWKGAQTPRGGTRHQLPPPPPLGLASEK
ncbi:unnamed protein product [Lampetra planeri]